MVLVGSGGFQSWVREGDPDPYMRGFPVATADLKGIDEPSAPSSGPSAVPTAKPFGQTGPTIGWLPLSAAEAKALGCVPLDINRLLTPERVTLSARGTTACPTAAAALGIAPRNLSRRVPWRAVLLLCCC
jgi:hypothetical protein